MLNVRKNHLLLFFISLIFLVSIIYLVFENVQEQERKQERQKIINKIKSDVLLNEGGGIPVIDISKIAEFSWDTLYIFPPYTMSEEISTTLGTEWTGSNIIESDDGIVLFVFAERGKPVQYLELPRSPGDFASTGKIKYARNEALFVIDEEGRIHAVAP